MPFFITDCKGDRIRTELMDIDIVFGDFICEAILQFDIIGKIIAFSGF